MSPYGRRNRGGARKQTPRKGGLPVYSRIRKQLGGHIPTTKSRTPVKQLGNKNPNGLQRKNIS